ncbi:hypothetical protein GOODEAATRI_017855 [Goodea atripinnis]|uniref:SH3 domain-containing protein n=1 Tax=Goodea atripinnis TaxID=208336 RepID=A0ABV0MIS4_9TELE
MAIVHYYVLNETAKQLMEIDKPMPANAPGPSSEPAPLGPCTPGPSPSASPSNGNGSGHRRGVLKCLKYISKVHQSLCHFAFCKPVPSHLLYQFHANKIIFHFEGFSLESCRFYCYGFWLHFPLSSKMHLLQVPLLPQWGYRCPPKLHLLPLSFWPMPRCSCHSTCEYLSLLLTCPLNLYQMYRQGFTNYFLALLEIYLALYAYKPQKADELELRKGEMYRVTEKCQDGWFKGTSLRTAASGVFPGNYVTPVSRISRPLFISSLHPACDLSKLRQQHQLSISTPNCRCPA